MHSKRNKWIYTFLGILLTLGVLVFFRLGLHRKPRFIRHFEAEEFA